MCEVAGHAQRLGAEAGAAAVGRPTVEGGSKDHHVGVGVGRRVVEVALGNAEEGEIRTELAAVTRHDSTLEVSYRSRDRCGPGCAATGCAAPHCDPPCQWTCA